jgi:hypothetical protein
MFVAMVIIMSYTKEKEQPPTKWLTSCWIENPPVAWSKFRGGFSMYGYLQNIKMNVSNAKRKVPKESKSLKSKFF